jgi:hypothetical protein
MIGVPKSNDLYLKDCKDNFGFFYISYIIIIVVDYCMPIDKMMFFLH